MHLSRFPVPKIFTSYISSSDSNPTNGFPFRSPPAGRVRHYFNPIQTVEVVGQLAGVCDDAPAQMFEDEIRKVTCLPIDGSARNAPDKVLLEFRSGQHRETGIRKAYEKGIRLMSICTQIAKQRFIEEDVKKEIQKLKGFVKRLPSLKVQQMLTKGTPLLKRSLVNPVSFSKRLQQPSSHVHVIQALKRIQAVAAQRQLDIKLYRAMFPKAYSQFMALFQASYNDPTAARFLETYVAPWQLRQNQLTPWEWLHVNLHNEGLDYVHSVIRQRQDGQPF